MDEADTSSDMRWFELKKSWLIRCDWRTHSLEVDVGGVRVMLEVVEVLVLVLEEVKKIGCQLWRKGDGGCWGGEDRFFRCRGCSGWKGEVVVLVVVVEVEKWRWWRRGLGRGKDGDSHTASTCTDQPKDEEYGDGNLHGDLNGNDLHDDPDGNDIHAGLLFNSYLRQSHLWICHGDIASQCKCWPLWRPFIFLMIDKLGL